MCRTFTTWPLSTQKGHNVQSGGLGKLPDPVSMNGCFPSYTNQHQPLELCELRYLPILASLCNCGTQITVGPKS